MIRHQIVGVKWDRLSPWKQNRPIWRMETSNLDPVHADQNFRKVLVCLHDSNIRSPPTGFVSQNGKSILPVNAHPTTLEKD